MRIGGLPSEHANAYSWIEHVILNKYYNVFLCLLIHEDVLVFYLCIFIHSMNLHSD